MRKLGGCANSADAQTRRMRKLGGCANSADAQTRRMRKLGGCANSADAQTRRMRKLGGCANPADAQTRRMRKPGGCANPAEFPSPVGNLIRHLHGHTHLNKRLDVQYYSFRFFMLIKLLQHRVPHVNKTQGAPFVVRSMEYNRIGFNILSFTNFHYTVKNDTSISRSIANSTKMTRQYPEV